MLDHTHTHTYLHSIFHPHSPSHTHTHTRRFLSFSSLPTIGIFAQRTCKHGAQLFCISLASILSLSIANTHYKSCCIMQVTSLRSFTYRRFFVNRIQLPSSLALSRCFLSFSSLPTLGICAQLFCVSSASILSHRSRVLATSRLLLCCVNPQLFCISLASIFFPSISNTQYKSDYCFAASVRSLVCDVLFIVCFCEQKFSRAHTLFVRICERVYTYRFAAVCMHKSPGHLKSVILRCLHVRISCVNFSVHAGASFAVVDLFFFCPFRIILLDYTFA